MNSLGSLNRYIVIQNLCIGRRPVYIVRTLNNETLRPSTYGVALSRQQPIPLGFSYNVALSKITRQKVLGIIKCTLYLICYQFNMIAILPPTQVHDIVSDTVSAGQPAA